MAHEILRNWGNLNEYWGILPMHYPLISMITPFDSSRGDLRQRLRQSQFAGAKICAGKASLAEG
jgi:hypothetical protein